MRMLKMKRFAIVLFVFFSLFFIIVSSAIYLLKGDDFSAWVSGQVRQSTGYDIRFDRFENNWPIDSHFSLVNVSVYQQQQRILFVKKIDVDIGDLNLWQRRLIIKKIHLDGVELNIVEPFKLAGSNVKNHGSAQEKTSHLQEVAWEKLEVARLQITDLNMSLHSESKDILLKEANVELNNLLLIDRNQWKNIPNNLDVNAKFKKLQLSHDKQKIEINNLQLTSYTDLLQREVLLNVSSDNIQVNMEKSAPLKFRTLLLDLQFMQDKLSIKHFSVNTFSGTLEVVADVLFELNVFPKPVIKIKTVNLESLLAKDMQIMIPEVLLPNSQSNNVTGNKSLPVEQVWVNKIKLKNISLSSRSKLIPLVLKKMDAQINKVYVIKDNQLSSHQHTQQSGSFELAFDSLKWKGTLIEQVSLQGSLSKDDRDVQLLMSLFTPK